jgi:hypothetical protein
LGRGPGRGLLQAWICMQLCSCWPRVSSARTAATAGALLCMPLGCLRLLLHRPRGRLCAGHLGGGCRGEGVSTRCHFNDAHQGGGVSAPAAVPQPLLPPPPPPPTQRIHAPLCVAAHACRPAAAPRIYTTGTSSPCTGQSSLLVAWATLGESPPGGCCPAEPPGWLLLTGRRGGCCSLLPRPAGRC